MGEVEIKEVEEISVKGGLFIAGFPGAGMAGVIATDYLVHELGMKDVAYVESNLIPPFITVEEGRIQRPVRIYMSKEKNLLTLVGGAFIPSNMVNPLSEALVRWFKEKDLREVMAVAGVTSNETVEEHKIVCAATDDVCQDLSKRGVEIMESGLIGGLAGVLLARCGESGIRGILLMAEAKSDMPDPQAALTLINSLNQFYSLKIDTSKLLEEAGKMNEQLNKLIEQYAKVKPPQELKRPLYV